MTFKGSLIVFILTYHYLTPNGTVTLEKRRFIVGTRYTNVCVGGSSLGTVTVENVIG